jgi:RND family efflux transporter MFP subunit
MSLLKQIFLAAVLLTLGAAAALVFVPAARPYLAWTGLAAPLERLGLIATEAADDDSGARGGFGGGAIAVVAAAPEPRPLNDIVTSIGTARAARAVALTSDVAGRIRTLHVASGDRAEAGQIIAELDDDAAQIALDRARLVLDDARTTAARLAQLRTTGASTDLQVQEADLALKTAELEFRDAEFKLSQFRVTAPFDGWVGILSVEEGDQIGSDTEITTLEDRSSLILDFRVPERVVRDLKLGDPVEAAPLATPGQSLEGRIVALDNRVDEVSRALRVRAAVGNDSDAYRPGMAFRITLRIEGESHPAVDPLAIQWNSTGSYVWVVRDGRAAQAPVRILQRNADSVLVDLAVQPGDLVVTEGVQALRPDAEVVPRPPGAAAPET